MARRRPVASAGVPTRRLTALVLGLFVASCLTSGPPASLEATFENRVVWLARLLEIEDRRLQDPMDLGEVTSSRDPWLRSRVALTAGRLKDPETAQYLPVLLLDPEPSVRRAAAFGAGISGDRRLVPVLDRALEDTDPATAAEAATALGRLGGEDAAGRLVAALGSRRGPAAAVATACFRLREPSLVPLLDRVSRDPSPALRRAAAYSLARSPRPGSAEALRRLLADEDPQVVAWAARGLGLLGDPDSSAALAALLGRPEQGVVVQALLALERLSARSALAGPARTAALRLAADEGRPGVALAALTLLRRGGEGDADVTGALGRVAAAGGRRGAVALASLSLPDPGRAAALAFAPEAPLALRLGATEALGLLPRDEAIRWASRLATDAAPRVRMEALSRFPREEGPLPAAVLARALADRDGAVRAAALEASAAALASAPELRSAWEAAFAAAVGSGEADWAVTALDAGAAVPGGAELLRRHADAPDGVVRERARRLLVDRFGARRESFRAVPQRVRLDRGDYRRLARDATRARLVATVTTARGTFEIELLVEDAPMTADSFASLAARRFFDGTVIHRVVPDFVVQAGDPRGDGSGGPLYAVRDELNPVPYERGTVGMALSGPDTGGSQWFVTLSPQPHLDGAYTVFGRVTRGMEVVERVEQDDALVSVAVRREARSGPPPDLGGR